MDVIQPEPSISDEIIAITPARARRKETARPPQPISDLSMAPAWIASPQLSGVVDLVHTETFPADKKVRPRRRRWADDWRELVIGASPYNRVSDAHRSDNYVAAFAQAWPMHVCGAFSCVRTFTSQ